MHYKTLVTVEILHIDDWESYCEASTSRQTLLDIKTQNMEQMEAVRAKMQEQIDMYQAKYMELLERMGHNENE